MDWIVKIRKAMRKRQLRYLIKGEAPAADRVGRAVDAIIERARRDERNGVRKDLWLFDFEGSYEEISDAILYLKESKETAAYRDLCGKLYAYAAETMKDTYMPLYLTIVYRYADALSETGEAEESLKLFEELYTRTDRLIGIDNPYGIHCLARIAEAAVRCGRPGRAEDALQEMAGIAREEFGPRSAMMLAVQRVAARLTGKAHPAPEGGEGLKGMQTCDCIHTDFGIQ